MHAVDDLSQGAALVATDLTGLIAGSSLLTMDGVLPVEQLSPGDRVITRDSGMAVLRAVKICEVMVAPIHIKPGSLGHTRPDCATMVLPGTRLLIRDWRAQALFGTRDALVPALRLLDGEFISQGSVRRLRLYALTFDAPHILYADGLEVCSE